MDINHIKFNYIFSNNLAETPDQLEVIEVKRTTQATYGGWTHATWVIVDGKRKRVAKWHEKDNYALEKFYGKGKVPELKLYNKSIYIRIK
jgi:phosphoserine phosphatase